MVSLEWFGHKLRLSNVKPIQSGECKNATFQEKTHIFTKKIPKYYFFNVCATIMMITVMNDPKKSYSDDNDQKYRYDLFFHNHNYTFLNSFIVHVIAYVWFHFHWTLLLAQQWHNDWSLSFLLHFCNSFVSYFSMALIETKILLLVRLFPLFSFSFELFPHLLLFPWAISSLSAFAAIHLLPILIHHE